MSILKFKFLIFTFLLCLSSIGFSQKITVVSLEDNQPIPGAKLTVSTKTQQENYLSTINGTFQIDSAFYNQTVDLEISFSGFESKTLKQIHLEKDTVIGLNSDAKLFEEVAVTAQYKSILVEKAVHNIRVIDREKIEMMAAQDLKDVLSNELNIRISEDDILGSGLQIQGIGGENVKILVDDVPLTGRLNGNIDLSQIPLDNIERIEVVEGPLSVSYGTDALAGTINIITKKNQGKKFEGVSNNYFESSGKVNNTVSLGWQIKKHQVRVEGGRHFFDGWDPSHSVFHFNSKPLADSSRVQQWSPKIQYFAGANYRYNRSNFVFNYSGQFFNEDIINKGMPRPPYQEVAFDDYYNTKRINQRGFFEYRFKNDYRLNIIAAYNGYLRQKNTKVRDLTEISDVLSTDINDHDTSQYHSFISRGRMIQAKNDKNFNYEVGYDILYEIAKGRRMLNERQDLGDYAVYVTAEYSPLKTLTFRPGLRYSYNTQYKAPLTPSLNMKYDFYEGDNNRWTLRASYARGFRSPSIKELHYTFVDVNHNIVGNPDLKAETANSYNLSFHHQYSKKELRVRNKISGFYTDINNLITLALKEGSVTEYSYFNLEKFASTGVQLESSWSYKNLSSTVGLGYIGRDNHLLENGEVASAGFAFSPEVKFNLQYNFKKIGLQTAVFYKYTGALPTIYRNENGDIFEGQVSDYHTADITFSKGFWKNRIKITLGVKNLFDVKTVEGDMGSTSIAESAHSSDGSGFAVGMGRTYNLGIRLQINSK